MADTNVMNIVDFLNEKNIQYQPASIKIEPYTKSNGHQGYKKSPEYRKDLKLTPKNLDFTGGYDKEIKKQVERISDEEIENRKKGTHKYPKVCIDTCFIHQIDVDFEDYEMDTYPQSVKDYVAEMAKNAPYYKSLTKEHGKHIFVKTDTPLMSLGYNGRPKTKLQAVEMLCGMWAYADKHSLVYNADKEIPLIDFSPYLKDLPNKNKKERKTTKSLFKKCDNDSKNMTTLYMNTDWSPQKKAIYELVNIMKPEYYTDYDYWTKIIWAFSNYTNDVMADEDLFDIAVYFSKKCPEKYDYDALKKLWENATTGNTIGTFYHYAKKSDYEAYYTIKTKYFLLSSDYNYLETDDCLANIFLEGQSLNYVVKVTEKRLDLYKYNGNIWHLETSGHHQMSNTIRTELRIYLYKLIQTIGKKYDSMIETCNPDSVEELFNKKHKEIQAVNNIILKIGSAVKVRGIAEVAIQKLSANDYNDVEFDNNGYLFTFRNKCFCLKTFEEVRTNREDYILTTTGYNWEESTQEQGEELNKLIDSIFPDEEIKRYYLGVLCSGMYGVQVEKFIIANGGGGNGKGVINELMGEMLGNYYYKANSTSFCQPMKEGNNPQMANLHNKRFVVIQECESENKRLNGTVIKEITGCNKINTRANYSNLCQINIRATTLIECNKKPKIDGRIDESYERRIDDCPFDSTFTNDERLLKRGLANVFPANSYYKEDTFKNQFKIVLFNYLFAYMKMYKAETGKLFTESWDIPKRIKDRTAEYLEDSDDVKSWFNDSYRLSTNEYKTLKEKVENKCFVECKLVYQNYKESQFYRLLTKKQQREQNLKWFYTYMAENINFKIFYKEKYTLGKKTFRNILFDHEEIEMKNDSEEECEDV